MALGCRGDAMCLLMLYVQKKASRTLPRSLLCPACHNDGHFASNISSPPLFSMSDDRVLVLITMAKRLASRTSTVHHPNL